MLNMEADSQDNESVANSLNGAARHSATAATKTEIGCSLGRKKWIQIHTLIDVIYRHFFSSVKNYPDSY